MKNELLFAFAAIVLIISVSCRKSGNGLMTEESEVVAPMDSLFGSMFPSGEPGAIVGITVNGEPVYMHGFGKACLDTGKPYTDSTATNICSATKSFVTTAVLKLVEDGKLTLDKTISDFFPDFNLSVFSKITIRHILTNSTGLPDGRPRNRDQWISYIKSHDSMFGISDDYMLYGRESEIIKFFESVDSLESEPGTMYRYQDPPFMLLGTVIEKASGMPFEKYMADSIFAPAGLAETCFFDPDNTIPNEAHGYSCSDEMRERDMVVSADGKWEEYDYGEAAFFPTHADRGIYTTARDYFKWLRALYDGKIIGKASISEKYKRQISTKLPNIDYGLGVFLDYSPGYPCKAFRMSYNGGFSIYQSYFPEQDIFVFVFSNRSDWNRFETGKKIDSILRRIGWI